MFRLTSGHAVVLFGVAYVFACWAAWETDEAQRVKSHRESQPLIQVDDRESRRFNRAFLQKVDPDLLREFDRSIGVMVGLMMAGETVPGFWVPIVASRSSRSCGCGCSK
jgi:hypothetical protein